MKPTRILWAFLFIIFVGGVIMMRLGEDTKYDTKLLSSELEMNIVYLAKNTELCLIDNSGEDYIGSNFLDYIFDEGEDLDDVCGLDVLDDAYVKITAVNGRNEWDFGDKKDDKKAWHTTWTNILIQDVRKITDKRYFELSEGTYELSISKIELTARKDVLLLKVKKRIDDSSLKEIKIDDKLQLKDVYDSVIASDNTVKKFILNVKQGKTRVDDLIPNEYEFYEYGDSYMISLSGNRPVWFEIEESTKKDLGMIYVEI